MAGNGKILITGATGNVGSAVLGNLSTAGVSLRTLAHDKSKAKSLGVGAWKPSSAISSSRRLWELLWRA